MAINKKKESEQHSKEEPVVQAEIKILKVKEMNNRKDSYRFSMVINDVTVYGCSYISYVDSNGNEKSFISFPQYKGSDNKYYNHCYYKLSDADVENVEKQIEVMIND